MMIEKITSKFNVWYDCGAYVVTATKARYKVFRGTLEECDRFIERYPSGLTREQARQIAQM